MSIKDARLKAQNGKADTDHQNVNKSKKKNEAIKQQILIMTANDLPKFHNTSAS